MLTTQQNEFQQKKAYQCPRITVISLRPEEAVLGNCKVGSGGGPNFPGGCANPGACTPLGS